MSPSAPPPPPPPPAAPEPLLPSSSGSRSAGSAASAAGRRGSSEAKGRSTAAPQRRRRHLEATDPARANDAFATLVSWGRNWLRRERDVGLEPDPSLHVDPLLETGRQLRAAREAQGLSLRQLAQSTRISTAVLEALEKGWPERLPEPTYLRPILSLLEGRLALRSGSLEGALPPRHDRSLDPRQDRGSRSLLVPSIELLGSWQGGLVYALLCAVLVYALNRQQQHLASQGLLTLRPIPALPPQRPAMRERIPERDRLLGAYPDLQPLERARRGQALRLLRQQWPPDATAPQAGNATAGAASNAPAGSAGNAPASKSPDLNQPPPPPLPRP